MRCRRFAKGGLVLSQWQRSDVNPTEFECISELLPFGGDGQAATTVFVAIRSTSKHQANTIRIRFNVVDPLTAPAAQAFVIRLLYKFYASLSWPLPPRIITALERFEPTRDVSGGITTTFAAVAGDVARFDLTIRLPEMADILPAGIFLPR